MSYEIDVLIEENEQLKAEVEALKKFLRERLVVEETDENGRRTYTGYWYCDECLRVCEKEDRPDLIVHDTDCPLSPEWSTKVRREAQDTEKFRTEFRVWDTHRCIIVATGIPHDDRELIERTVYVTPGESWHTVMPYNGQGYEIQMRRVRA